MFLYVYKQQDSSRMYEKGNTVKSTEGLEVEAQMNDNKRYQKSEMMRLIFQFRMEGR